ncbi:MAG: acylphosphatase [Bacteroidales bacterium]
MKKRYIIRVQGRVQGVGYRFSCMETAYKLGIHGYVKNLQDRSVYIEAEGEENDLQKFLRWCAKGPLWARVTDIRHDEAEPEGYKSFDIRR